MKSLREIHESTDFKSPEERAMLESIVRAQEASARRVEAERLRLEAGRAFRSGDVERVKAAQPAALSREAREENRRQWLRSCGVPPNLLHATRAGWERRFKGRRSPWPVLLDQWHGKPWCLNLRGAPDQGKSHAAVALMVEWARLRRDRLKIGPAGAPSRVFFLSIPALIERLREAFAADDGRTWMGRLPAEAACWILETFDLVVLDDLAAQPDRDTWNERVSTWVYLRHAQNLPTITTSNLGGFTGLDERATRRLADGLTITF